jgi:hypothetical protein
MPTDEVRTLPDEFLGQSFYICSNWWLMRTSDPKISASVHHRHSFNNALSDADKGSPSCIFDSRLPQRAGTARPERRGWLLAFGTTFAAFGTSFTIGFGFN